MGEVEMILGQIGEYRELSLEERRERLARDVREMEEILEGLQVEKKQAKSIAEKFAEALGCLEDAVSRLERINRQYDPEQYADEIRLVRDYGLPPCNPVMDFWLQTELAQDSLKDILCRLRRVESLAPKGIESVKEGEQ